MKYNVVSIGGAVLDVFFQSSQFQLVQSTGGMALCERFNEKVDVERAAVLTGGAGTNTAVGFSRLGFKSAAIVEIGNDLAGHAVLEDLKRENVNVSLVVQEQNEETGVSGLLVSQQGARTAMVHRGASRMLTASDVKWEELDAEWIHLSAIGNVEFVERVIAHCAEKGIRLSWNPGNFEIDQIAAGAFKPNWEAVSVLFVNREEMSRLSGEDLSQEEKWKSEWCFHGPRVTIITDGKNGGRYCEVGKVSWFESASVNTVEETGAGDSFAVGFVAGQLTGKSVQDSIEYGKKNAASVVAQFGAKPGLLHKEELFS